MKLKTLYMSLTKCWFMCVVVMEIGYKLLFLRWIRFELHLPHDVSVSDVLLSLVSSETISPNAPLFVSEINIYS